jgi:hypothetical protein
MHVSFDLIVAVNTIYSKASFLLRRRVSIHLQLRKYGEAESKDTHDKSCMKLTFRTHIIFRHARSCIYLIQLQLLKFEYRYQLRLNCRCGLTIGFFLLHLRTKLTFILQLVQICHPYLLIPSVRISWKRFALCTSREISKNARNLAQNSPTAKVELHAYNKIIISVLLKTGL